MDRKTAKKHTIEQTIDQISILTMLKSINSVEFLMVSILVWRNGFFDALATNLW